MRKQKKEKWNFMNVSAVIIAITLVSIVIGSGKLHYQPHIQYEFELIEQRKVEMEVEFKKNKITLEELELKMIELDIESKEMQLKCDVLYVYFKSLPNGAGMLDGTEKDWVHYATKFKLDYKRAPSISLHETYEWKDRGNGIGHGRSEAIYRQFNVSGINLQQRERDAMGIYGYKANLKTYQSIEESIMATCKKLSEYREWYGAETLTDIQKIYAPTSDPRSANNGGNYGDNTKWLDGTIKHYNGIQAVEDRLRKERGL